MAYAALSLAMETISAFAALFGLTGLLFQIDKLRKKTADWRQASKQHYGDWKEKIVVKKSFFIEEDIMVPRMEDIIDESIDFTPRKVFDECLPKDEKPVWIGFLESIGKKQNDFTFIPAKLQRQGIPMMPVDGRLMLMLLTVIGCEGPTGPKDLILPFDTWICPYGDIFVEHRDGIISISIRQQPRIENFEKIQFKFSNPREIYAQGCGVFLGSNSEYFYIRDLADDTKPRGTIDIEGNLSFTDMAREWSHLDSFQPTKMLQPVSLFRDFNSIPIQKFSYPFSHDFGGLYDQLLITKNAQKELKEIVSGLFIEPRVFVTNEISQILLAGACQQALHEIEQQFPTALDALQERWILCKSKIETPLHIPKRSDPIQIAERNCKLADYVGRVSKQSPGLDQFNIKSFEYFHLSAKLYWIENAWTTRIPNRIKSFPRTIWLEGAMQSSIERQTLQRRMTDILFHVKTL